jgi:LmbE family N-acetylglucosaminyl deacetylase
MIANQKKIIAVVAHPDDETFGMGGTLATYASKGVEVHLICATRGEAGEVDAEMMNGFESIGKLREHELCCAADILGLRKVHFLGYRDSGMPLTLENQHPKALIQAPLDEIAEKIAKKIQEIEPQVVITFDPIGGYMHPDHIMIYNATNRAFFISRVRKHKVGEKNKPEKLFLHIFPRGFLRIILKLFPLFGKDPRRYGKNGDIDLMAIMDRDFPIHVRIDYRQVAAKRDSASACHASQGGDRQSGYIVTWLLRLIRARESFMQAFPKRTSKKISSDFYQE